MRLALMILPLLAALPAAADTLVVMPLKFLDTSHEARDQTADHKRRLGLMTEALMAGLPGAKLLPAETVAAACAPETPDCLFELAREQGGGQALFVVVQKSSTLIIQTFGTLADTGSQKVTASPNLNFRGDTDESWTKAGAFLAGHLTR